MSRAMRQAFNAIMRRLDGEYLRWKAAEAEANKPQPQSTGKVGGRR